MTGFVTNAAGQTLRLPVLIRWQVLRCGGDDGCDSFFCVFPAAAADAEKFDSAVYFHAEHEGKRVFTGVVDEFSVTLDEHGRLGRLDGRGLCARLIDNQCRAAEYDSAQLGEILRDFVIPYGIEAVAASLPAVARFAVDTGDTCRQAVWGYVRHAGARPPRFDEHGRLLIGQPGKEFSLSDAAGATQIVYTRTRHGVLSQVVEVRAAGGAEVRVTDEPDPEALPVRRVTVVSGSTVRAERRTGAQMIGSSKLDARVVELTVPGLFLAEPEDICTLNLAKIGIKGTFRVRTVRSALDSAGARCTLTMGGL